MVGMHCCTDLPMTGHASGAMIRPDTLVALSALHPDPSAKVMQAMKSQGSRNQRFLTRYGTTFFGEALSLSSLYSVAPFLKNCGLKSTSLQKRDKERLQRYLSESP